MAPRAPSSASRSAMPRPTRLAAPVTRTTLPASEWRGSPAGPVLDRWLAMHFDFLRFYALARGLGQSAGYVRPGPENGSAGAKRARDGADRARVPGL